MSGLNISTALVLVDPGTEEVRLFFILHTP